MVIPAYQTQEKDLGSPPLARRFKFLVVLLLVLLLVFVIGSAYYFLILRAGSSREQQASSESIGRPQVRTVSSVAEASLLKESGDVLRGASVSLAGVVSEILDDGIRVLRKDEVIFVPVSKAVARVYLQTYLKDQEVVLADKTVSSKVKPFSLGKDNPVLLEDLKAGDQVLIFFEDDGAGNLTAKEVFSVRAQE